MAAPFPRHTPPAAPAAPREEVCPPEPAHGSWWQELRDWLVLGWPIGQNRPEIGMPALGAIRQEFAEMLDDIHDESAEPLYDRIQRARSMRELWHLRADLHSLVARHFDQVTADERLQALNRHFPKRSASPRPSGFGSLTTRSGDMWP